MAGALLPRMGQVVTRTHIGCSQMCGLDGARARARVCVCVCVALQIAPQPPHPSLDESTSRSCRTMYDPGVSWGSAALRRLSRWCEPRSGLRFVVTHARTHALHGKCDSPRFTFIQADVEWLPFFLDERLPQEGVSKLEHYNRKFGGALPLRPRCSRQQCACCPSPGEHTGSEARTMLCCCLQRIVCVQ